MLVESESLVLVPVLSLVPEDGNNWPNSPIIPESRNGPPAATSSAETPASPAPFNPFPALPDLSNIAPSDPLLALVPFVSEVLVVLLVEVVSLSDFETVSDVPVLVLRLRVVLVKACTWPAREWQAVTMSFTSRSDIGSAITM